MKRVESAAAHRGLERVALACFAALALLHPGSPAAAQEQVTFIEVVLDEETTRADGSLRRYLGRETDLVFSAQRPLEYGTAINTVVNWDPESGEFLARMTPYAFVAAEMLGADVEILATYVSRATGSTTYHSYFVVNRERFSVRPELGNIAEYLKLQDTPARFIYHDQFSTSSYFLPSLYFRDHGIFNMSSPTEFHTAIRSEKLEGGSSDLVKSVAQGESDIAAVWDGTKTRFETTDSLYERYGSQVHFIQLSTALPNDLLVASASMNPSNQAQIREAIARMSADEIDEGDFLSWLDYNDAPRARLALADLRQLAREQSTSVTVDVLRSGEEDLEVLESHLDAARHAVRLAGTEFVNYDDDFHEYRDYIWTLKPIHDGAILLASQINGSALENQEFQISFRDTEDLTQRIGAFMNSRMHRIRYVWPYQSEPPTVIRDAGFSIPQGNTVKVRRITWQDVQRNHFLEEPEFDATVVNSDVYKFELSSPNFMTAADGELQFDPMSNISYRVVLVRDVRERAIFRVLTVVFIILLVGAAVTAFADLRGLPGRPSRP